RLDLAQNRVGGMLHGRMKDLPDVVEGLDPVQIDEELHGLAERFHLPFGGPQSANTEQAGATYLKELSTVDAPTNSRTKSSCCHAFSPRKSTSLSGPQSSRSATKPISGKSPASATPSLNESVFSTYSPTALWTKADAIQLANVRVPVSLP